MNRLLISIIVICLLNGETRESPASPLDHDHLVPIEKNYGSESYQRLWQQKLLLTAGNVARFVSLPGNVGEESAVSVYEAPEKKGGMPGGYWLTVTQASSRLWDCIADGRVTKPVNPKAISVDRCDVPIPESTARSVGRLWLVMLSQTRQESKSKAISVDSSREIFSTATSAGRVLKGQLPKDPKERTLALVHIANLLVEHCNVSIAERADHVRKIEQSASALLMKVHQRD